MDEENLELLTRLLSERSALALSVLIEGKPYIGQLPFALRSDGRALLIHASRLARHSRGLSEGAPFSALIQGPEDAGSDPFQIPRVALQGRVELVEREASDYELHKATYLQKLPSGRVTFSLGDFSLYQLVVETGRFVAGFGRAYNLDRATLQAVSEKFGKKPEGIREAEGPDSSGGRSEPLAGD